MRSSERRNHQKIETLEEFLKRGGAVKEITRDNIPPLNKKSSVPLHVRRWKKNIGNNYE